MKKNILTMLLLSVAASGCSAVDPSASGDPFKRPLREILFEPATMVGDSPFCIWGSDVSVDEKHLDPAVLGVTGKNCTSQKPDSLGKYRRPGVGFNFPFWQYKTITLRFKRTPEGEYLTYKLPLSDKLEPRPESRLMGLRLIVTENSVKVERWDIRKNPAKPGIANEFDDHTAIIEMKESLK